MKKLLLSGLTVGLVAGALGLGVYAYFFYGSSTAISVDSAAGLDITYDVDADCDTVFEATGLTALPPTTTAGPLFPGDTQSACVQVNNNNDTDVDVYVRNDNFGGGALQDALDVRVINWTANTTPCAFNDVNDGTYTTANGNRGCDAGNIGPNSSALFEATVLFVDDNTDQSALASLTATWDTNVEAYTTP